MTNKQKLEYFELKEENLRNKALNETEHFRILDVYIKELNYFLKENTNEKLNLQKKVYYEEAFEQEVNFGSFNTNFILYRTNKSNDVLRLNYEYDYENFLKDIEELGFQEDFDKLMKKYLDETNEIEFTEFCKKRSIDYLKYMEL